MGATDHQGAEGSFPKALNADTVWLVRFGNKDWRHKAQRAAQDWKFQATLKPRLDRAIEDWHATQPTDPQPVVSNEPINDELQTGDSRLLGGAMSISSPWSDGPKQDPPC